MNISTPYHVVLFKSVNQTMWANNALKQLNIPHKLVPVPRHISSDCGVCIRIGSEQIEAVRSALSGLEGYNDIMPLKTA